MRGLEICTMWHRVVATWGLWLALTANLSAQAFNYQSFLGQTPPELQAEAQHWLGWDRRVSLADLRGQVVWLQFNF